MYGDDDTAPSFFPLPPSRSVPPSRQHPCPPHLLALVVDEQRGVARHALLLADGRVDGAVQLCNRHAGRVAEAAREVDPDGRDALAVAAPRRVGLDKDDVARHARVKVGLCQHGHAVGVLFYPHRRRRRLCGLGGAMAGRGR